MELIYNPSVKEFVEIKGHVEAKVFQGNLSVVPTHGQVALAVVNSRRLGADSQVPP